MTLNIGIIGSTRGTSAQGLIDAARSGEIDGHVRIIISNVQTAVILERAKKYEIPELYLSPRNKSRVAYDQILSQSLRDYDVDIVVLVGYMRILGAEFIDQWRGRILNIHPSLLPAFSGGINLDVHQAVLNAALEETGCTVHHVNEIVDGGEIILQKACPVLVTDTAETLKTRVQALESQALVEVLQRWSHR